MYPAVSSGVGLDNLESFNTSLVATKSSSTQKLTVYLSTSLTCPALDTVPSENVTIKSPLSSMYVEVIDTPVSPFSPCSPFGP